MKPDEQELMRAVLDGANLMDSAGRMSMGRHRRVEILSGWLGRGWWDHIAILSYGWLTPKGVEEMPAFLREHGGKDGN